MSAEVQQSEGKKGNSKGKQKKMHVRVDFTPMVDMNMLLITFFMLCTTLSKPQTMELVMPKEDKDIPLEEQQKVQDDEAITLLLDSANRLFYYEGMVDFKDYTSLKETNYTASGIREVLLRRNAVAVEKVNELKQRKRNLEISTEELDSLVSEVKGGDGTPTVIIKPMGSATYKNMVDALDEMQICNIGKYAMTGVTAADSFLIQNYITKGEYGRLNLAE
jgi:biopolymer transport protein ExbD